MEKAMINTKLPTSMYITSWTVYHRHCEANHECADPDFAGHL